MKLSKALRASVALLIVLSFYGRAQQVVLPEGTPIRMKINRTVSSADARQGDNVDFTTIDDVKNGDVTVIPKGATAMATITEAEPKRRMGRGGKLNMNIDYVRLPDGGRLALRGIQDAKGGGHTGAMTGAMVATSIVFFPAAPLFLFMKGKDITIPEGHEVTVYTNTEYKPGSGKAASPAGPNAPGQDKQLRGTALTNQDVVKMKKAGLSDSLILQKIQTSPGNYKLDTDDLLALKQAGLSDSVISAMMKAHSASH